MKAGTGPAVKLRATELCKITKGGNTVEELTGESHEGSDGLLVMWKCCLKDWKSSCFFKFFIVRLSLQLHDSVLNRRCTFRWHSILLCHFVCWFLMLDALELNDTVSHGCFTHISCMYVECRFVQISHACQQLWQWQSFIRGRRGWSSLTASHVWRWRKQTSKKQSAVWCKETQNHSEYSCSYALNIWHVYYNRAMSGFKGFVWLFFYRIWSFT